MTTRNRKQVTSTKNTEIEDPITGFKSIQIRRLAYRAGAERIESDTYDCVRQVISEQVSDLLRNILVFTTHTDRKTVTLEDLEGALESKGKFLMAGGNTARDIKKSKAKAKKPKKVPSDEGSSSDPPKKPHRFRPGTVANQEIKRNQETSDRLIFKQNRFEAYVRDLTKKQLSNWGKSQTTLRFSKEFFKLFQVVMEEYLVRLLEWATKASAHANRKSISKKDVDFIYAITSQ